jgi:hypothetical protein
MLRDSFCRQAGCGELCVEVVARTSHAPCFACLLSAGSLARGIHRAARVSHVTKCVLFASAGDVKIVEADDGADADADGDVQMVEAVEPKQEATPAASSDQQKEQQQQQQQEHNGVKDEVVLADSDDEQQQQQQGEERAGSRATSPSAAASAAAPAAGSWQLPVPLDGSVEVTEDQLKQLLPSFHSCHAMDCQVCKASLAEAVIGHQEVKQQLEVQRAALSKLLAGSVTESLEPGLAYYLVPK